LVWGEDAEIAGANPAAPIYFLIKCLNYTKFFVNFAEILYIEIRDASMKTINLDIIFIARENAKVDIKQENNN